jgi:hypothetical protein
MNTCRVVQYLTRRQPCFPHRSSFGSRGPRPRFGNSSGLDPARRADRVGWPAKKVTNVFDGWHVVRLEQLEAALAALRRLVVTSEPGTPPPKEACEGTKPLPLSKTYRT